MKLLGTFLLLAFLTTSLANTDQNTVYDDDEEDYTDTNPFIIPSERPNVDGSTERPSRPNPNNGGGNFYQGQSFHSTNGNGGGGGGSTYYSTNSGNGGGSTYHSTGSHFSSDGSNVFISSNKGPNGEDVVTISVTNPNVRIEGETCNYNESLSTCFETYLNTSS